MSNIENREDLNKWKQALKAWIGGIAHETAGPLSAVRNYSQSVVELLDCLLKHPELSEQYPDLKSALRAASGFKSHVPLIIREQQNFMEMTVKKAQANEIKATLQPLIMKNLIHDFMERYPFRDFDERNRESDQVQLRLEENFSLNADPELFYHLLANLMKNALYALKVKGDGDIQIQLSAGKEGDSSNTLIFKDSGSGISAEVKNHLFEIFYSKTQNGAGVGLFLCRNIMGSFRGSIECESVQGETTTFTLKFPKV